MYDQPFASADPRADHIAIRRAPCCLYCGGRTKKSHCVPWNENGNARRPYYFCPSCGEFACFGDMRGVLAENPTCYCNDGMQFSRRAIAGPDVGHSEIPRSIFYNCATGECLFFDYMRDGRNSVLIYDGPMCPVVLTNLGF